MAKRKLNKAAKIREKFEALGPEARPKDVIAALAAEHIKVSSAQVSNVKATMGGSTGGRKARKGELTLDSLLLAKAFADRLGMARAQAAVAALAKLAS
jgi:hypothetical protein